MGRSVKGLTSVRKCAILPYRKRRREGIERRERRERRARKAARVRVAGTWANAVAGAEMGAVRASKDTCHVCGCRMAGGWVV